MVLDDILDTIKGFAKPAVIGGAILSTSLAAAEAQAQSADVEDAVRAVRLRAKEREVKVSRRYPGDRYQGFKQAEIDRTRTIAGRYEGIVDFRELDAVLYFISRGDMDIPAQRGIRHRGGKGLLLGNGPLVFNIPAGKSPYDVLEILARDADMFPSGSSAQQKNMLVAADEILELLGLGTEFVMQPSPGTEVMLPNHVLLAMAEAFSGEYLHQDMPIRQCKVAPAFQEACRAAQVEAIRQESGLAHSIRPGLEDDELDRLSEFISAYGPLAHDINLRGYILYCITNGVLGRPPDSRLGFKVRNVHVGSEPHMMWVEAGQTGFDAFRELAKSPQYSGSLPDTERRALIEESIEAIGTLGFGEEYAKRRRTKYNIRVPEDILLLLFEASEGIRPVKVSEPVGNPPDSGTGVSPDKSVPVVKTGMGAVPSEGIKTAGPDEDCCADGRTYTKAGGCIEPRFRSTGSKIDSLIANIDENARRFVPDVPGQKNCRGLSLGEVERARALLSEYRDHLDCFLSGRNFLLVQYLIEGEGDRSPDPRIRHHAKNIVFGDAYRPFFSIEAGDSGYAFSDRVIDRSFGDHDGTVRRRIKSARDHAIRALGLHSGFSRVREKREIFTIPQDVMLAELEACEGIYPPQVEARAKAASEVSGVHKSSAPRKSWFHSRPAITFGVDLVLLPTQYPNPEGFYEGDGDGPPVTLVGPRVSVLTPWKIGVAIGVQSDYGNFGDPTRTYTSDRTFNQGNGWSESLDTTVFWRDASHHTLSYTHRSSTVVNLDLLLNILEDDGFVVNVSAGALFGFINTMVETEGYDARTEVRLGIEDSYSSINNCSELMDDLGVVGCPCNYSINSAQRHEETSHLYGFEFGATMTPAIPWLEVNFNLGFLFGHDGPFADSVGFYIHAGLSGRIPLGSRERRNRASLMDDSLTLAMYSPD